MNYMFIARLGIIFVSTLDVTKRLNINVIWIDTVENILDKCMVHVNVASCLRGQLAKIYIFSDLFKKNIEEYFLK